ncbi:diguanylate cyclase domain-containing protein [Roseateles chitosanitabidus]|uniref:diguanylate cyclase domain-containing protein n=1 Tax=Roseateles chitosanitabidus TaxID=65048 RepID=UPI00082EC9D2|nr:diguanylate cyclase [Roseateles chitosanitabidus]
MRPPPVPFHRSSLGRGVALLILALAAMALLVTLLAIRARDTLADLRRFDQINLVLPSMTLLLENLLNAETGQRGYLLTQKTSYLQPYRDAVRDLDRRVEELVERDKDPAHAAKLERVRELVRLKMAELSQTVRLHESGQHDEALELVLSDQGQHHMNELRDLLGELTSSLRAERAVISDRLAVNTSRTELLLLAALAMLALFTIVATTQVFTRTRALSQAQRRLRGIADNVPAQITQHDRAGALRFANAEVGRVHHADPATLLGKNIEQVSGAQHAALLQPFIARVLAGEAVEFDAPQTVDGETLHFHRRFVPDLTGDQVTGFYAVSLDITERKRAEAQVAASERRMKAITDNLPVFITYVDREMRLRYANETLRNWFGLDPDLVIGLHLRDGFGETLYEQRRAQFELAMQGERVEFEVASVLMGKLRHLRTIYVPDRGPDGVVLGAFTLAMDITAMKQAEAQLARLASSDALTGLPNRRELDQALTRALARQRRHAHHGGAMALLFLDVDRFKAINDTHGHGSGDAVLREFAQCLRRAVRSSDIVARIAGDEFVAVLEGLNKPEEAAQVAAKIVESVRVARPGGLEVTASVGVATVTVGEVPPSELIALADRALYQAKREGRDGFAVLAWPGVEQRREPH